MSTKNSPESPNIPPAMGPALALIAGPTASGKSDLAVSLALELQKAGKSAVIINADSAQVYSDLSILSARPSEEEMRGVPHVLFGSWDGAEACSAADWASAAKHEIEVAHQAGIVPILVGGTGLYIRTLLDGIAPIPEIDPAIREAVRALPVHKAYTALRKEDPERAAMLAPADSQRIARALEVLRSTGHNLSHWHEHMAGGLPKSVQIVPLILLPEREALYQRCDERFLHMFNSGAQEEVAALMARKLDPTLPVMRAIGVRDIAAFQRGEAFREEAIEKGCQATRNYVKRQFTWLRNQPPQDWPRMTPENVSILDQFEILFRK